MAWLNISPRTAEKIIQLHDLTPDEVRQAVQCVPGLDFGWHHHPERGLRAIVRVEIRSRPVLVVLYDAEDPVGDVYNLGSAYFIDV
ncbi:hypothetical protein [Micromonospora aurantiaca (nom. illeg.)]|uniref:hypothetical protein n=1 Tax=Micromonospora aurantiaca (nom. illeg.) TaxID=47850 RepID=UPI001CDA2785|nr:hypothetical protein [Micromonospora aurantiaca]